ncbi:MAG: S46 family peptidase [Thermoanaerobaculia bacterium]
MKRLIALALVFAATAAFGIEGKWTPQQVLQLDAAWLKQQGLEIPPSRLWDPARGTGLLAATVNIGGCSGGFISPQGLFITNHHCLFGVLQEHATPQNDIITNGFLARSADQELKSATLRAAVPRRFVDVTADVLGAVPAKATDAQRHRAIEKKQNELVAACEKNPGSRCRVASFEGGLQYILQEMTEFADVRLVYAPPRAIGEFGGEIDNWMWPRHTGDFSIARVYKDGKPFTPEFWMPLSTKGVKPGDFVMTLGYPGVTYRALTADEMAERHAVFVHRTELYGDWIRILETTTKGNAEGEIAVADDLKSLYNRHKNAEGQLAGFRRGSILDKQRAADDAVKSWAGTDAKNRASLAAYDQLAALASEKMKTAEHDFLIDHVRMTTPAFPIGPKELILPLAITRAALQRQKSDDARESAFMERNIGRVRQSLEREQKNLFPAADKALFASWVRRALALPQDQRIAAVDSLFTGVSGETAIGARIEELYAKTKVFDLAERLKMFGETPEQLRARKDPLLEAGFALNRDIDEYTDRRDRWDGAVSRLRPEWRRAVLAHAGKPVAPDANSTLRVSFAHVQGYEPRDGVFYKPQTTLGGVVEKHTNEEPFDVPDAILAAARAKSYGMWKDEKLGDVPVAFLADADTTGGNSGSPVVNARGEVVGVNFDRVWENVANDFGYNPAVNRNISVDTRYLLWILDQVEKATGLLEELGVNTARPSMAKE